MKKRNLRATGSSCFTMAGFSHLTHSVLLPVLACLALAATGCQVLTYTGPNGERFSRASLGTTTSIAALALEAGTNGLRRVELQGYQNDANQALGTVTEAAVRAALKNGAQ